VRGTLTVAAISAAGAAGAATLDHAPYGTTQDGRTVEIYTLTTTTACACAS
jgi:hypothetical protein